MLLLPTTVLAAEGATASTGGIYDVLIPLIVLLPILGFAFTALFGSFVLPFEIVSVLLLAAVIGGVFLAKREHGGVD